MALDFPNTPTVNQIFTASNGVSYVWDGSSWNAALNPISIQTALPRNRIVNGAMQVSQELGTTSTSALGAYFADQWLTMCAGVSINASKTTSTSHQIGLTIVTGKAMAASDFFGFSQPIEGDMLWDFGYGSAAALPSVLRFEVVCPIAGTYGVSLRNGASNRSLVLPFTVSTINAWVPVVLPIPGDTTGTWAVDNTMGMSVSFMFACGATFSTAPGVWTAGNFLAPTGITNGAAVSNSAFYLKNVGLYSDPNGTGKAPPWEMPDEASEISRCRRYWQNALAYFRFDDTANTGVTFGFAVKTAVWMRTTPTVSPGTAPGFSGWTNDVWAMQDGETLAINMGAVAAGVSPRLYNKNFALNARM